MDGLGHFSTQTDALGHIYRVNDEGKKVWWNNFKGIQKAGGMTHLGIENMPSLTTRAILVDLAGYSKGYDDPKGRLDDSYAVSTEEFIAAMKAQGEGAKKGKVEDVCNPPPPTSHPI